MGIRASKFHLGRCAGAALVCLAGLMPSVMAFAHPMGNFSINQYFLVDLREESPIIYYLADIAEIPSFTELDLLDTDFDSQVTEAERSAYLERRIPELFANTTFRVNGQLVTTRVVERNLAMLEGLGGMVVFNIVMKMTPTDFTMPAGDDLLLIEVASTNFEDESGTRECYAIFDGRFENMTRELGRDTLKYQTLVYIDDHENPVYQDFDAQFLLHLKPVPNWTPLSEPTKLAFSWTATARAAADTGEAAIAEGLANQLDAIAKDAERRSGGVSGSTIIAADVDSPRAEPADTPSEGALDEMIASSTRTVTADSDRQANLLSRVSDVIRTKELSFPLFLMGMAIAVAMGMGHAFSPGHGKTVMAAYLIGERGTYWHALILGIVVTITHTWSVLLLGLVTLYAGESFTEESLQFWTGLASGVIILILGIVLFQRRYRTYLLTKYGTAGFDHHHHGLTHDHGHSHDHGHHDHHGHDDLHEHDHGHSHVVEGKDGKAPTYGSILWLGISGGIVPCPAALIVLLLALKFGRLVYGLWLIVAFSVGLAAVLVAIGIIVVRTAGAVRRRTASRPGILLALPVASSLLIAVLGAWIVFWTLVQFDVLVIMPGS